MRSGIHFSLLSILAVALSSADAQMIDLRRAAQLDAEQRCDEAEAYYRQALAESQPSLALLNNVGNHYLACGQPNKAAQFFERVVRINPAHNNANLQLARIAAEHREGAKALAHLSQIEDSTVLARIVRAEAIYWMGNHPAAIAMLDAAQRDANGDPAMLLLFGITCRRLALYERSETAFNSILARNPLDFDTLLELGRTAVWARDYGRAESALTLALNLHSEDSDALFQLAQVFSARQDYSRAVYLLARANHSSPNRAEILLALARAAQAAEYYGDSAMAYDEYLQLRPLDDVARRDRALVYGLTGTRSDKAFQELRWYLRKHPSDSIAYYNLAQVSWKTRPEEALRDLSTALRLNPKFAAARYSRGWLLHRLGRDAEGLADLQSAANILPNVGVLISLGSSYLVLDRPSDAEKVLRQALAMSPANPEALMQLGRALMDLGRENEAQNFLDEFQKVRPQKIRGPLIEPRMIELATLSSGDMAKREIERLREDLGANPGDSELQLNLSRLLLLNGRVAESQVEFRHLLKMNIDGQLCEEAGTSLLQSGNYELAKEFLQRAALERPNARIDLAAALFLNGSPDQALAELDQMPDGLRTGDYFFLNASILDAFGMSAQAEKVLDEGLRRPTSRPQIAQRAVLLLTRNHRDTDALGLIRKVLNNNPDNPELLLTEAILTALIHQEAGAENRLREMEARWPEWDRPYLVHGLLLDQAGNQDGAKRQIETALALGSKDPVGICALAHIENSRVPDSQCSDLKGIRGLIPSSGDKP
jgi:tetratricopeptide (TPR) repeat protein